MTPGLTPPSPIQSLFLQHASSIRGYVLGLVGDTAAADDLFQDVFLTIVAREADFRRDGDFLAWVRGIVRFKVLEYYRRQRSAPLLFDEALLKRIAESWEHAERRRELWERRRNALAQCLERLSPRARQIINLRYADQPLTPPEIARRVGWTTPSVNVALARARAFLRKCTREYFAPGESS
jgi:RNA polymerase sigma-70 factor (ECF subfamily)